ncbi:putative quinol monooxygenase [Myroides sp. LJL116]
MFVRIVKLSFKQDQVENFLTYFEKIKHIVRNQPGCSFLELYQDKSDPSVFFTYSYWQDPQDLDNYRYSATFKEIWPYVKTMFKEDAMAWSVDKRVTLS